MIARVSTHTLREERAYHICKSLTRSLDPDGSHLVRSIDIVRLSGEQEDEVPICVSIFEHPGSNYLTKVIDYGPAWYSARRCGDRHEARQAVPFTLEESVSLQIFLDFAIGAAECLETFHGQQIVHGEIRGDAFHMNLETGRVRVMNFGSGLRTFEHDLTSMGWSVFSKEVGAKTKLSYMSPEQTGRMPTEPDSRTDIFSLGILFWTMLTQKPAFKGETPMDIIRAVLGRRLPPVSSIRLDIPDVIGRIIQKATAKSIGERYHTASGLRHDLAEVRKLLSNGDSMALENWQIATKDVSWSFILPTVMIGRTAEHDEVVKVIDRVSTRYSSGQNQEHHSTLSGPSISQTRHAGLDVGIVTEDGSSDLDIASSIEERPTLPRTPEGVSGEIGTLKDHSNDTPSTAKPLGDSVESHEFNQSNFNLKTWEKNTSSLLDSAGIVDSVNVEDRRPNLGSDGAGTLAAQVNTQRFRRKGRCEVVSVTGAAGLGKSLLIQSVQVEARRRGFFASSKFDQTEKIPFGPVLKLLSSLFKQVFSESSIDATFHEVLKQYVRPVWPRLHKALELPEFLLGIQAVPLKASQSHQRHRSHMKNFTSDLQRREQSPLSSHGSLYSTTFVSQDSQNSIQVGSSTSSMPLMNTVLDVLRVFTYHKFICFCLEDLQFADDESLELIAQIVSSRMRMVVIVTYRPDQIQPGRIKDILESQGSDEIGFDTKLNRSADQLPERLETRAVGITRVMLKPLCQDNIIRYVAATLCRPEPEITSLAAVVQSRTAGNPFYMREMLDTCHRKKYIWYDYRESDWRFDLDRILKHFDADNLSNTLNSELLVSRLSDLPAASTSILAWASLLGTSFSFGLIQRLMSGEFQSYEPDCSIESGTPYSISYSQRDTIEGLQAAIQACILVATEDDDRFHFAHERYVQAAASLGECNRTVMHFIIAQTLLNCYSFDDRYRDTTASHICESIYIIRDRVVHRQSFRKLLFDCARNAAESGARSTAMNFYANCFELLQKDPWDDDATDTYYDETLELYTRAAECYLYMGHYDEAKRLLLTISSNAKSPADNAPAWILQARVFAQEGNSTDAFQALKQCLAALDIKVDDEPTFEKCDVEFRRLSKEIQSMEVDHLANKPISNDSNFIAAGAVLVETISAAFWSDTLTFYQMSLVMINTHLMSGSFPQAGIGFIHLAVIAITRFNMIEFGSEMGKIALALMDRWRDPYTMGRGGTIYSTFVGHIQYPLTTSISQLEEALEYAIRAGDRMSTILNFGLVGNLKFFASEHLAAVESFCAYGCEEVPNWHLDTPGGTMLIAIRQVCRALQGKTFTANPLKIMSDESHDSLAYKSWLVSKMKNSDRPLLLYESIEVAPLFLYGYYTRAIELGSSCLKKIDAIWSARNTRFVMFFQGLSLAGSVWRKLEDIRRPLYHNEQAGVHPTAVGGLSEAELREEITGGAKSLFIIFRL